MTIIGLRGQIDPRKWGAAKARLKSRLLEFYSSHTSPTSRGRARVEQDAAIVEFPRDFSFATNPDGSLGAIEKFVEIARRKSAEKLFLNQKDCTTIGHSAESVLNALALDAGRILRKQFLGSFPSDVHQREIVCATGLPKYLGVQVERPPHFETFPLRHGCQLADDARRSSRRDIMGTQLTNYLDRCLSRFKFRLTDESKAKLGHILGEVLVNAEEHSGRPDWWISGYLRELTEKGYADCHICIFNFGDTLAETLQTLPAGSLLAQEIRRILGEHRRQGHFGQHWNEEALWTLAALQEGVSRRNRDVGQIGNNGQGIPDIILYFQELGQLRTGTSKPKMFLMSGGIQIIFDERYPLRFELLDGGLQRRIVALNRQNDLRQPPAAGTVRVLKHRFPGTLLGMDFFLDPGHLERLSAGG